MPKCLLCPHECNVDRDVNLGFCQAPNKLKINLAQLHFGEEPIISGNNGSGTIFLSYCNLRCIYCQNYKISALGNGKIISEKSLINTMFKLKEQGANNINFVSPMHYTHLLIPAISKAKKQGLNLPIVWNTNSYEKVETLKKLEGLVDIYLADFRYWDDANALKYSHAINYQKNAKLALKEMLRQTGRIKLDDGLAWFGTLIRILVMPNNITGTRNIIKWIHDELGTNITISLMAQFYPTHKCAQFPELNRTITTEEYKIGIDALDEFGFDDYYLQELNPSDEWTPDFFDE